MFLITKFFLWQLCKMLVRKFCLKKLTIQLAFFFASKYKTNLLNTSSKTLLNKDKDDWLYLIVFVNYREEIFLQEPCLWIESSAETSNWNDCLTNGMLWLNCQLICWHFVGIEIVNKSLLAFFILSKELDRTITLRANALATIC